MKISTLLSGMMSPKAVGQSSRQLSIDESFDYVIKRQRRKTIALHILPDATVEVRAPNWVPKYELAAFVEQRAEWVVKERREVLKKLALKPRFLQGQQHYYLGQRYPIVLQQANKTRVSWQDGCFYIAVPAGSDARVIETALERWYRRQALELFEERLFACFESFPDWFQDKYPMPGMTIRKMRRRWGSCSSRGDITLNLVLVKMPVACIDYVICHELCHLEVFHHGKAFYRLLEQVNPNWKQHEVLVERFADC